MAYTKYSLTPANNNAAPPDGAPEGMLPSAVNDTMRDMMAQIRDCGDGIRGGTYTMTAPVITGGSIDGATVGATTASSGKFTSLSDSGNFTFTGTGNRITGDFSNATQSNRVAIQTSTTNGSTVVNTITNGTGSTSAVRAFNTSTADTGAYANMSADASSITFSSAINGAVTALPLNLTAAGATYVAINTNGNERMRVDSSGNVGIGVSPSAKLHVVGEIYAAQATTNTQQIRLTPQSSDANIIYSTYSGTNSYLPLAFNIGGAERMRITSAGAIQMGADGATSALVVAPARTSRLSVTSPIVEVTGGGGSGVYTNAGHLVISGRPTDTAGYGGIYFQTGATQQNVMVYDNAGNLVIGPTSSSGSRLEVNAADEVVSFNRSAATDGVILRLRKAAGTIGYFSTNTYSLPSDERVKKNIVDIGYGLNFVNSLRPVQYNTIFQDPNNESKKNFGLIAQEVEQTLINIGKSIDDVTFLEKIKPENDTESRYGLGYQNLVPVLIKAIQELNAKVIALEEQTLNLSVK